MKNFIRTLAYIFLFALVVVSPVGFEFPGVKQRAKMPLYVAIFICIVGLAIILGVVYLGLRATGLLSSSWGA